MATRVLTDAVILHGAVDLTGVSNQVSFQVDREPKEATVFGNAARQNKAGLFMFSGAASGFVDYDADDDTIYGHTGTADTVFTVAETNTDGAEGVTVRTLQGTYTWGDAVGEMLPYGIDLSGSSGTAPVRGTVMHPKDTARGSTGNGTARQLGAVAAGERVYGALHVHTVSGTTPTLDVVVQSDDSAGFASPTTRLTFPQATTATASWQSAAGAITDDWWRVTYTIGGTGPSFEFLVIVGIL